MTISQGYLGSWESANVWVKGACPYHMYRLDLGLWRADTEVNDKSSVAIATLRENSWVKPNESWSENRIWGKLSRSDQVPKDETYSPFASMSASKRRNGRLRGDARKREWLIQELLRDGALLTPSKRLNSLQNSDSLDSSVSSPAFSLSDVSVSGLRNLRHCLNVYSKKALIKL